MDFASKSFSLLRRDVLLFITNLVTGILIARFLGPKIMGLWTILLLIPSYAEAFGRIKFDIASVYFLGKKESTIGEMIFSLNLLATITSFFIVSIFISQFEWFYSHLFHASHLDMRSLTYFVLIIIPLQFIYTNYSYLHIYREDVSVYNMMAIIEALISSLLGLTMLLILKWGIFGILLGKIIGLVVSNFYTAFKLSKIEKIKFNFNSHLLIKMAKYSFSLYIGGLISHIQIYFTNLLAAVYLAPAQVAFFSMAKGRGEMFTRMVPSAIGTLLFPKISKQEDSNQSRELTSRAFRITFLILLFTGILLALFIKPIVFILYGKDYLPLIVPFWIILPGLIFSQSTIVFTNYFSGIGRADLIPKIAILPLIFQIFLAYSIIPIMGIIGASITFLSSCILVAIIQIIVFLKVSHSPLMNIVIKKMDFYTIKVFLINQFRKINLKPL